MSLFLAQRGMRLLSGAAEALRHAQFNLAYQARPEDIFIVTYPKSGTTWVQMILYQLMTDGSMDVSHLNVFAPYLDDLMRAMWTQRRGSHKAQTRAGLRRSSRRMRVMPKFRKDAAGTFTSFATAATWRSHPTITSAATGTVERFTSSSPNSPAERCALAVGSTMYASGSKTRTA